VKKKRQGSKTPLTRLVGIFALSVSIFFIINLAGQAAANYRVQREAYRLAQDVEALQAYQAQLLARRTYVASDLYVEHVARNELKWAKPAETVVVILPEGETKSQISSSSPSNRGTAPEELSPPQAWWRFFFGPHPGRLQPVMLPQTENVTPPDEQASANLPSP